VEVACFGSLHSPGFQLKVFLKEHTILIALRSEHSILEPIRVYLPPVFACTRRGVCQGVDHRTRIADEGGIGEGASGRGDVAGLSHPSAQECLYIKGDTPFDPQEGSKVPFTFFLGRGPGSDCLPSPAFM